MKIKTGDTVVVIAGKDKGAEGTVLSVDPKKQRVVVEGVNMMIKHNKPGGMSFQGSIEETEAPLHVSNVMLKDPKTGERTRVGYREEDGKKVRYAKVSGETITYTAELAKREDEDKD